MDCPECGGYVVDTGHELTCTSCGLCCQPEPRAQRQAADEPAPTPKKQPPADRRPKCSALVRRLREMCARGSIHSEVVGRAVSVLQVADELALLKNRRQANQDGVLAAAVFHACRLGGNPRTPVELSGALSVPVRTLRRMAKTLQLAVDEEASRSEAATLRHRGANYEQMVPRFMRMLGIFSGDLRRAAEAAAARSPSVTAAHRPESAAGGLVLAAVRSVLGQEAAAAVVAPLSSVSHVTAPTLMEVAAALHGDP